MKYLSAEYVAGFFDGEGCINITISGKNAQARLRVTLVNTDYSILERIQGVFGGTLTRRPNRAKPHWKPFCSLMWIGQHAVGFLATIAPHLILKSEQAHLAIEFSEFMAAPKSERCHKVSQSTPKMPNRVNWCRTEETIQRELEFKNAMHELNRRGVPLN